jgi:hypothetical protein
MRGDYVIEENRRQNVCRQSPSAIKFMLCHTQCRQAYGKKVLFNYLSISHRKVNILVKKVKLSLYKAVKAHRVVRR